MNFDKKYASFQTAAQGSFTGTPETKQRTAATHDHQTLSPKRPDSFPWVQRKMALAIDNADLPKLTPTSLNVLHALIRWMNVRDWSYKLSIAALAKFAKAGRSTVFNALKQLRKLRIIRMAGIDGAGVPSVITLDPDFIAGLELSRNETPTRPESRLPPRPDSGPNPIGGSKPSVYLEQQQQATQAPPAHEAPAVVAAEEKKEKTDHQEQTEAVMTAPNERIAVALAGIGKLIGPELAKQAYELESSEYGRWKYRRLWGAIKPKDEYLAANLERLYRTAVAHYSDNAHGIIVIIQNGIKTGKNLNSPLCNYVTKAASRLQNTSEQISAANESFSPKTGVIQTDIDERNLENRTDLRTLEKMAEAGRNSNDPTYNQQLAMRIIERRVQELKDAAPDIPAPRPNWAQLKAERLAFEQQARERKERLRA